MELVGTSTSGVYDAIAVLPAWTFVLAVSTLALAVYYIVFQPTPAKLGFSGPRGYPLLGAFPSAVANFHRVYDHRLDLMKQYADRGIYATCGPDGTGINVSDPKTLEHFLSKNFNGYAKSENFLAASDELQGDGIFNTNGDKWLFQRKSASHMFSGRHIRESWLPELIACGEKLVTRVVEKSKSGEPFDIQDMFFGATMDAIGLIAFGTDFSERDRSFEKAFDGATEHVLRRNFSIPWKWRLQRYLQTPGEREFSKNIKIIDDFAFDLVRSRKEALGLSVVSTGTDDSEPEVKVDVSSASGIRNLHTDVLSLAIKRAKKMGEVPSEKFLRDVALSFVIAGRDTTACLLTWLTYELSLNQDVQDLVVAEVEKTYEEYGELSYEALGTMEYTEAVIFETLRLHPSVAIDVKRAVKDDILPCGRKIKKGMDLVYSPYVISRLETVWSDPLTFNPNRWLEPHREDSTNSISQYKFVQFNAGPRVCLGKKVALLETKTMIAALLRRLKFSLASPSSEGVHYKLGLTMSVVGGLFVRTTPRK